MSQYDPVGNDSASEIGSSLRNLKDTIDNYKEGQKSQGNKNDSRDKPDNKEDKPDNKEDKPDNEDKGGSSNSESPGGSEGKDTPDASVKSDNPTSNTGGNEQGSNAPQQENNPSGNNNNAPSNNQPSKTPQGNDNTGNTPQTSSGSKPGDTVGGGSGASTNAGTIKAPSSIESGSQAASQGAQAAQKGAEAAKQAGEVAQAAAEGAAEGSVVPGYGTVAVAAAKVAWASRHTIAKVVMVIILIFAILASAIESLPGVIWQMAFEGKTDENGEVVEYVSIEEIYGDLVGAVQDFVNTEYTKAMEEAVNAYNKGSEIKINNELVKLNELNTPIFGDGLGDEKTKNGKMVYEYSIGSDICEIIATFTVKCKLENIAPTQKNFKKYLGKSEGELFEVQVEDSFEKEVNGKTEDVSLKKIVYEEYTQVPESKLNVLEDKELPLTTAALKGFDWSIKNQRFIKYLENNPNISVEGYESLCKDYNTVAGSFYEYASPDGNTHFQVEGSISNIKYNSFIPIGGDVSDTRTRVSTYSTNAYYEHSETEIISSEDYGFENTGKVEDGKFRYIITNGSGIDTTERDKNVIQPTTLSGFFLVKRGQVMTTESVDAYGIPYKKITVSSLNRNALLECFGIDKSKHFPLVADYSGNEVAKDDGTTEKVWSVSQDYTPEEFTCGMAITSYVELLRSYLYGSNSEIIQIAPAKPVVKYEILVTSSGNIVSGARVVVKYNGKKITTLKTNSNGVAVYEGKEGRKYDFVVSDGYETEITEQTSYGSFMVDEKSGFILPFQTTSDKQYLKVTSEYGLRDDMGIGASTDHGGMDIIVKERVGDVVKDEDPSITQGYPIRAVADGKVIYSGEGSGYGYYVWLEHEKKGCQTLYAHCSVLCVKSGDDVVQGQIIAYAGNTGTSTGPHLHFETRVYEDGDYKRKNPRDSYSTLLLNESV